MLRNDVVAKPGGASEVPSFASSLSESFIFGPNRRVTVRQEPH